MRCPKCHYISYDSSDRCRNCGYELSLAAEPREIDLPIQTGDEALGPLRDLPLVDPPPPRPPVTPPAQAPARASRGARGSAAAVRRASDLPLFADRAAQAEAPLVSVGGPPRPPLSVRRGNPAMTRTLARVPVDDARREAEPADDAVREAEAVVAADVRAVGRGPDAAARLFRASAVRRIAAAVLDGIVLMAIDVAVVYFTLRIVGFSFIEILLLPPVPLVTFLLLLNGGYLSAFTAAGGQTLGKMAAGIKVVPAEGGDRVPPAQAVLRSAGYLASALPVGLGFLPGLLGPDGRAVHDRLADTLVIRA